MENLRKVIGKQLKKLDCDFDSGTHKEENTSWILIEGKEDSGDSGVELEISFNYKGTKITDITLFDYRELSCNLPLASKKKK